MASDSTNSSDTWTCPLCASYSVSLSGTLSPEDRALKTGKHMHLVHENTPVLVDTSSPSNFEDQLEQIAQISKSASDSEKSQSDSESDTDATPNSGFAGSVAFIGGGNMASAIISGLQSAGSDRITVVDIVDEVREKHRKTGCNVSSVVQDAANSDVVVVAVKPQVAETILSQLAVLGDDLECLVVSVMAGIPITKLEELLPRGTRVIRSMPNTPMAIGKGMVGICAGTYATEADVELASSVFSVSAKVLSIDEGMMDALTAVSGSGPAYFFRFCEVLQAGAVELGFTQDEADLLVSTTAQGSIDYLCGQDGFPAGQLRKKVTSPGGTTAAALNVFSNGDLCETAAAALKAAEARGKALAAANM